MLIETWRLGRKLSNEVVPEVVSRCHGAGWRLNCDAHRLGGTARVSTRILGVLRLFCFSKRQNRAQFDAVCCLAKRVQLGHKIPLFRLFKIDIDFFAQNFAQGKNGVATFSPKTVRFCEIVGFFRKALRWVVFSPWRKLAVFSSKLGQIWLKPAKRVQMLG
jgi:hypothetical protein